MRHSSKQAKKSLLSSVINGNIKRGTLLINQWLDTYGFPITLRKLIHPVIKNLNQRHSDQNGISLPQSYALGAIIDQSFSAFAKSVESKISPYSKKGRIVLGNAEGDFHALGRKMVATIARMHHWEVIDLGTSVLAGEFVDAAVEHQATIIGVSAMTYTNAKKILAVRQMLNQNHLETQIRLVVGGAVFNLDPQLAEKIGADGTAPDALESIKLFEQLCESPNSYRRKDPQSYLPTLVNTDSLIPGYSNVPLQAPS